MYAISTMAWCVKTVVISDVRVIQEPVQTRDIHLS